MLHLKQWEVMCASCLGSHACQQTVFATVAPACDELSSAVFRPYASVVAEQVHGPCMVYLQVPQHRQVACGRHPAQ
jgi:hypothetical protein